jgi:outer membrane receptor protein involved in Fe transport
MMVYRLGASVLALTMAQVAWAQSVPPNPVPARTPPTAGASSAPSLEPEAATGLPDQGLSGQQGLENAAETGEQTGAEIVVTGSRISRRDYVSASPIVTTSQAALQATGAVNVEQSLNQLPQFVQGQGQQGGVGGGGTGRATLNLRGLGDRRNLILLDGRRLPPSDTFGVVDVNIIPQSLIESVETITGGASAVYGSDAISGVVNFRTKRSFDGIEADVQYGDTFRTDRHTLDASLTGGLTSKDDRAHAILNFGYTQRGTLFGTDRKFYRNGVLSSFIGQGTYVPSATNLPTQAAINAAFPNVAGGAINRTQSLGFNDDGSLFGQVGLANYKGPTDGFYSTFGNVVRMPVALQSLQTRPQTRYSAFGKFDYELSDGLTAYAQVLYVESKTKGDTTRSLTQFYIPTVSINNPFIPASLRAILASRPNPNADFVINKRFTELPAKTSEQEFKTSELLVGLRGKLPVGDWTFDAFAARDRTKFVEEINVATLFSRVQSLLQASDGGRSLCTGGYNAFGLANNSQISQSCINYLTANLTSTQDINQNNFEASAQGSLFKLPAGDVKVSLVADYRENSFSFVPDSQIRAGNAEAIVATNPSFGRTKVKELAGEVFVPILRDAPFFKSLNLTGGLRYSDYNVTGGVFTYKAELEWQPIDTVLLRGGYQRAIRSPNIGELFSSATGGQVQVGTPPGSGDPCDVRTATRVSGGAPLRALCIATGVPVALVDNYNFTTTGIAIQNSGNRDLDPENATTKTLGLVWRPQFGTPLLSNFSFSVDYYDIKVKKIIATIDGVTALSKCYNQDGSNPTYDAGNAFCQLIARDATGGVNSIALPYLNLGGIKTSGIDFQADWAMDLGGAGRISVNALVSYLDSYKRATFQNSAFQEFRGTIDAAQFLPLPKWRSVLTTNYTIGKVDFGLRWRFTQKMRDVTSVTRPTAPAAGVPNYSLFDLNGRFKINDSYTLRAGITNLFDKKPPVVGGTLGLTQAGTYDVLGRSFYVGMRARF